MKNTLDLPALPAHGGELLLIRHGQSTANAAGIGQGRAEYPLSTLGVQQAELTARHLATHGGITALYTSPQERAAKTAAAIGRALGLVAIAVPDLVEIDIGELSGRTMAQLATLYPTELAAFEAAEREGSRALNRELLPGWEPVAQIVTRSWNAIGKVAARHPGERVVIVAHGGVLNAFLAQLLLTDALEQPWAHSSGNCAITHLRLAPTGPEVVCLVDDAHLIEQDLTPVSYTQPLL